MDPQKLERLLTTKEAAEFLSISPNTLKFWRVRGHRFGPTFIRLGGAGGEVRYSPRDLAAYVRDRSVQVRNKTQRGTRRSRAEEE